jgi:hypothetical protein
MLRKTSSDSANMDDKGNEQTPGPAKEHKRKKSSSHSDLIWSGTRE